MCDRPAKRPRREIGTSYTLPEVRCKQKFNSMYFSARHGAQSKMFARADERKDNFCVVHECEFKDNQGTRLKSRSYASYKNHTEFPHTYLALNSGDRHFYEIIRDKVPLRFYLDIEFKVSNRDDADASDRLSALLELCVTTFAHELGITVDKNDWIVQNGSRACDLGGGERGWKHSFHVNLASVYFDDNATVLKPFMTVLHTRMEADCRLFWTSQDGTRQPIVDFATNTRNRVWRLPLSSKAWDGTPLVLTSHAIEDALVTVPPADGATIVRASDVAHLAHPPPQQRSSVSRRVHTPRNANPVLAKLTLVLREWGDATSTLSHEQLLPNGAKIFVGRTVGSRTCPWGHTHDSNNFYLTLKGDCVWYHCHGDKCRGKSEAIGVSTADVDSASIDCADPIVEDGGGLPDDTNEVSGGIDTSDDFDLDTTRIHTVDAYDEQHVKPYGTSSTAVLLIKSGMNTGKTTELRKTLRREKYARVIVITTRIAFARTMLAALRPLGFKLYQEVDDVRNEDLLIIEYESLRKLVGRDGTLKPFDCVVMDEVESLLCNTTSPTNGDCLQVNKTVFEGLITTATRVYAMDADLSNKTMQFFKDTVGADNITLHHNQRRSLERKVVMDNTLSVWLRRIKASLDAGKRIVVASGSKKIVDAHVIPIIEAAAGRPLRYKFYHGECDDTLLNDFDRIDKVWSELDVVIFTSKVTVGADFSVRGHFDHIFAYGCVGSVPPRVLLQMCGRCRYPTENVIYACVPPSNHEGTRITLEDVQERHRIQVGTMRDTAARILNVGFNYDQEANMLRIQPTQDWIGTVYAYNCLEDERARVDLGGELIRAALAKGYTVVREDGSDTGPIPSKAAANAALRERRVREFDETASIDAGQADEIGRRQARNRATEEDKRQLAKFNHQRLFTCDVNGEHYVTVGKHIGLLAQICISLCASPLASVLQRDVDKWQGSYAEMAAVKFTRLDLVRKVARLLGLDNELDTTTKVSSDNIMAARQGLNELLPSLWSEFSLKSKRPRDDVKQLVGLANTVLGAWCGGRLKQTSKKQRRHGASRERVYTYRLVLSKVLDGKTLIDIAKDSVFFHRADNT
jgi:hypothetical protein